MLSSNICRIRTLSLFNQSRKLFLTPFIRLEHRCRFSSVTNLKDLISELSNKPPVPKSFIQNAMVEEASEEVKEMDPIERDAEGKFDRDISLFS